MCCSASALILSINLIIPVRICPGNCHSSYRNGVESFHVVNIIYMGLVNCLDVLLLFMAESREKNNVEVMPGKAIDLNKLPELFGEITRVRQERTKQGTFLLGRDQLWKRGQVHGRVQ